MKEIFIKEAFGIINRIRKRDFSGYTGTAVKNSILNFMASIVLKGGSLLFTIIIARMLLPELFGLYSLTLSTIVFLSVFSDLGVGTTLINMIAKELAKKRNNAGAYVKYLLRLKIGLTIASCLIIIITSYFIAHLYYNKPIFLALLSGAIYIFANSIIGFYSSIFQAINKFQATVYKEIIFQVARLILVPLSILLFVTYSTEIRILAVFISLSIAYLIALVYLYIVKPKFTMLRELNLAEKKETIGLVVPLTAMVISGMFFGYIDTIILGRYMASTEYIGYYSAAMTLISSISAIIGFSGAIFPIFSRLDKTRLKLGLKKAVVLTLSLSIISIIGTLFLSRLVVLIVYGADFIPSVNVLRILSLMLLIDPLIAIYSSYHIVLRNQNFVARTLIYTTAVNIILNISFISLGLRFSSEMAIIGAAIATLIARGIYLVILMAKKT